MAIRCLEHVDHPLARSALCEIVAGGKTIFGKARISAKSTVVLEAIRILALKWSGRSEVDEILELASRSKDLEIQRAARVEEGGG